MKAAINDVINWVIENVPLIIGIILYILSGKNVGTRYALITKPINNDFTIAKYIKIPKDVNISQISVANYKIKIIDNIKNN